jgi:hypothetical protein
MISRDMYRLLKRFPRWPRNKKFEEIGVFPLIGKYHRLGLAMHAKEQGLIGCNGKEENDTEGFYLTEIGEEAIEEYRRQRQADAKATWAIVISILSLAVSIAAILMSGHAG